MEAGALHAPGRLARTSGASARTIGPAAALTRLGAFTALSLFAALHWSGQLRPAPNAATLGVVFAAAVAGLALIALGARPLQARANAGAAVVGVALLGLAFVAAGVPLRQLVPDRWDDLAAGIVQGLSALPGVSVPYRGADEWVRLTVALGGGALIALAAVLAFWPRREPVIGFPLGAAAALVTLYAVPIIERGPRRPMLDGAIFCVLLAAFLWLERLRAAQLGVATACIVLATGVGALVAARLDGDSPWLDYQALAERLEPQKAAVFDWNHGYGPLDWPRDGREVLRIKARTAAYWKTTNLDLFDGLRWRSSGTLRPNIADSEVRRRRTWVQSLRVVNRGLRSREFVTAGTAFAIGDDGPLAVQEAPGTFVTGAQPLRPGNSYTATVYTPKPTEAQLRGAGTDYPDFLAPQYLSMVVAPPTPGVAAATARFTPFGTDSISDPDFPYAGTTLVEPLLARSPYARAYELATTLRERSATPYEFLERVRDRVQDGATYSETPPPSVNPLMTFLFEDRRGYCQHFAGATALLLRMGGVHARVVSGFSPGRFDPDRKEYVVRDDDAHSWVEAYFPGIGWHTIDPTPAIAPARSQTTDGGGGAGAGSASGQRPDLPGGGQLGDRPFASGDPGATRADEGGGRLVPALLGGAAAVAIAVAIVTFAIARRRRTRGVDGGPAAPELSELQRALARSGRRPAPDVTLARLEASLGGSEAARAYLRAVRSQRFGPVAAGPTPAQRRALRHELGLGLGLSGRLRAWWALPPTARMLKLRRHRP